MFPRIKLIHFNPLQEMEIGPYKIPKGTTVMAFLYHVHHDPKFYEDPKTFNPSRFIDASGKFIYDERIIPLGIGKRACLGQTLAEKEFYIFFTNLMQQFEFQPEPNNPLPSYKDIYPRSLIRNVPPYKVVLKKRLL